MPPKDDMWEEEGMIKHLFERELLNQIANMLVNEEMLRPEEQLRFIHLIDEEG